MFFILRKKLQKIGIILVAINLLACGHQPDFKDITHLAESGDAGAQAKLGELYVEGQVVPQDYKKAFEWYSKAANQGNAEAQNNLGAM
ncbi:tetratricopeptide repeat protein, partial [Acinetobacter baumannii]